MNTYTSLHRVKEYLNLNTTSASANATDDPTLLNFINRASRSIDKYTRRRFYPRLETRFYDYIQSQKIFLDDDLLSLSTLKTQNGACTVASGVLFLQTGQNWNRPPYNKIVIKTDSGSTFNYSGTTQRSNEVTGHWGYHEDYNNAWVDTGASLATAYTASAGSMNLAGAGSYGVGASDTLGEYPRISVGDLIKIGDQFLQVIGGGTSGNGQVNVVPYANGTAGASAAAGASIAKFSFEPDVEWAARRLTAWLYGERDTPYTTRTAFVQLGTLEIPQGMAVDIRQKLNRFVRTTFETYP